MNVQNKVYSPWHGIIPKALRIYALQNANVSFLSGNAERKFSKSRRLFRFIVLCYLFRWKLANATSGARFISFRMITYFSFHRSQTTSQCGKVPFWIKHMPAAHRFVVVAAIPFYRFASPSTISLTRKTFIEFMCGRYFLANESTAARNLIDSR